MDMHDNPNPERPPSGTPTHPIEISDGSSFHGSPYRGPDSYEASTPQPSSGSHYPPLYEDPHIGGPSNPVSEVDSAPVAPPSPPHMGFDNPIPSYAGAASYNPFEQSGHSGYNYYNAPDVDPYLVAANYNALHPEGPYGAPYQTGYPAYGYQYLPPPQPLQQQQP
ncbi:cAMP-binding protein 1-like [Helianthus annuus]|uniref:cAMP-binding protein 1-like n=1 Tax=Helianthus annuus TaxID=4232 RepID=UPI000B8F2977|nr:cAMP-binding protein 1-like [Helianthus annuus]